MLRNRKRGTGMLKKARAEARAESQSKDAAATGHAGASHGRRVLESSRQIWLAGLGAFARAQGEGMKVFETLVSRARRWSRAPAGGRRHGQRRARGRAGQGEGDAGEGRRDVGQARAGVRGPRGARAVTRLGVHTQSDVERLAERVDALSEAVNELIKVTGARTSVRKASPVKRVAKGSGSSSARKKTRPASKAAKAAMK
jgi:poly(hydroxyalkanoate) granule-associated protein